MRINGTVWSARDIASRIDHTVLAPDATRKDMENACALARAYGFKAVFTNPYWTPLVAELLDGSGIAAGISAAFPLGSLSTDGRVPRRSHISGSCVRRSPPTLASSSPASERSMLRNSRCGPCSLARMCSVLLAGMSLLMCCPPAMPRSGCLPDLDVSSAEFGGNALLHA